MNNGGIVLQLIFIFWLTIILAFFNTSEQECIQKKKLWSDEKQENLIVWTIEGDEYLVRETPRGQHEIVGLYSRYE